MQEEDHHALQLLLDGGADPNSINGHGKTPLHDAAFNGDVSRISS